MKTEKVHTYRSAVLALKAAKEAGPGHVVKGRTLYRVTYTGAESEQIALRRLAGQPVPPPTPS